MFGIKDHLDDIEIEDNHYIGYPYDSALYQRTNFSIVAETHFDGNQEFHPTEKTYRAIANMHPFAILTTPYFLVHLKIIFLIFFYSLCKFFFWVVYVYKKCQLLKNKSNSILNL